MRLSPHSQAIIHQTVQQRFGDRAQVRLFGSRLDDTARGGDIDLHVRVQGEVNNPVWEAVVLATQLQLRLDGRKVDVRLADDTQNLLPIDAVALSEGVLLL